MNSNPYLAVWEQENTNKLIKELYWYYNGHGFKSIVLSNLTRKFLQPLILTILLVFTTFIWEHTWYTYIIYTIAFGLLIHSLIGLYGFGKTVTRANRQSKIYKHILYISEEQLQTANFSDIVNRILDIHNNILSKEPLSELDIARIITLKDNYIIGMINHNFDKYLSAYKPFVTEVTTTWFDIVLDYCGLFHSFDQSVQQNVIFSVDADEKLEIITKVKKRLRFIGLAMLIFMPVMIIGHILTLIFTYAERISNNPQFLSARQWTHLALYKFRDYNELVHDFKRRINNSYEPANVYINYFDTHWLCILSEFAIFVLGGIFLVLLIMTLTSDEAWYVLMLGIIGTIIALIRSTQPNEHKVYSYSETMQQIVSNIHYLPDTWITMAHTPMVYNEFSKLFAYQLRNWTNELLSLLLCPYIFGVSLANNADKLVNFMQKNTTACERVGYVFKLTLFEKEEDNTHDYSTEDTRKLQMSIINFQQNYPESSHLFAKSGGMTMHEHLTKTFSEFVEPETDIEQPIGDTFTNILDDLGEMIDES